MTASFSDHFKSVARHYADNRPTYPSELFGWLAGLCPGRDLAWDCATGTGQAAADLAAHFARVVATDASATQIAEAKPHPGVDYHVAPADASGLDAGSADLVVVAQALHWFNVDDFHREVERVLKPGGVIAEWCYGVIQVEGEEVDRLVQNFYWEVVGPYWPAERRHVETGYRELPFPFPRIEAPPFAMRVCWNLDQLLGYARSWSATARCTAAQGEDPVAALGTRLEAVWGEPERAREIAWPLSMRVGLAG